MHKYKKSLIEYQHKGMVLYNNSGTCHLVNNVQSVLFSAYTLKLKGRTAP